MHKTIAEATIYARQLANLHNTTFHVVELPEAQPGSSRDIHRITGRYYGGVRTSELGEFTEDGCVMLATVKPDRWGNGRGLAPENDFDYSMEG